MKEVTKAVLFLFVASLSLISCNKDDDNNNEPITSGNIVGKWEISKVGVSINGTETLQNYDHQTGCSKDFDQFLENGTLTHVEYNPSCVAGGFNSTYVKNGNTIIVTDGGGPYSLTINQLDASILKTSETYTEGGVTYSDIIIYNRVN